MFTIRDGRKYWTWQDQDSSIYVENWTKINDSMVLQRIEVGDRAFHLDPLATGPSREHCPASWTWA